MEGVGPVADADADVPVGVVVHVVVEGDADGPGVVAGVVEAVVGFGGLGGGDGGVEVAGALGDSVDHEGVGVAECDVEVAVVVAGSLEVDPELLVGPVEGGVVAGVVGGGEGVVHGCGFQTLVAVGGVLLARVTQLKQKGDQGYVGVATGMNALIRPALYGAFHEIVNLSRLGEPAAGSFDVVGPICETGDVLGHDRLLPVTREGDVLLVANAGAYGRSMASSYNLRHPPEEIVLPA